MRVKKLNEIVEFLQGTCMHTLDDAVQEVFGENFDSQELTQEELEFLDNEIFKCGCCGWWCEISEMSEQDQYCSECFESENE